MTDDNDVRSDSTKQTVSTTEKDAAATLFVRDYLKMVEYAACW